MRQKTLTHSVSYGLRKITLYTEQCFHKNRYRLLGTFCRTFAYHGSATINGGRHATPISRERPEALQTCPFYYNLLPHHYANVINFINSSLDHHCDSTTPTRVGCIFTETKKFPVRNTMASLSKKGVTSRCISGINQYHRYPAHVHIFNLRLVLFSTASLSSVSNPISFLIGWLF